MLIKYGSRVVNLNLVSYFQRINQLQEGQELFSIGFDISGNERSPVMFNFESEEERDLAFEKILDYYRWQRMQCTLD